MMYSFFAVEIAADITNRGSYKMTKNDIEFAQRLMLVLENDVRERAEIDERRPAIADPPVWREGAICFASASRSGLGMSPS